MTEQERLARVGELATRVGYPMPAIRRTDDHSRPWVELKQDGTVGPTLVLRCCADQLPPGVFDFLVAQDLVQARAGAFRHRQWMNALGMVIGLLLGFVIVLVFDWPLWGSVPALIVTGYALLMPIWLVRTRIFLRRSDRMVTELLGPEHVRSALEWLAACGTWRKDVQWIRQGAVPHPLERLRRVTAG